MGRTERKRKGEELKGRKKSTTESSDWPTGASEEGKTPKGSVWAGTVTSYEGVRCAKEKA